jgi:hypothetical protein
MNHKSVYLAIAMGLCVASVPVDVHAQKQPVDAKAAQLPDFIYQGRLEDGGALADGVYDLEFRLFDAATGGAQVGATISETDFPVMDGLFTINLAFPGAFVGQQLFLQVTIDGVTLPRQPISTAPVAQFALSASTATTADFASTAGTATTATTATTADSASTAGFATTAGSATSATTADFATTAGSAMTATSATNATQLGGVAGSHFARLYGDGSAGDLTVAASTPLQATNTSYHNITISAGTLTIPSGTLLRCTGSFTLAAGAVVSIQTSPSINTLLFNPASRVLVRDGAPGIGLPPGPPDSRTSAATALIATPGGPGLGLARARGLREIGPYGGAGGPSVALENVHTTGGAGGGAAAIRCAGAVTIRGTVRANGGEAAGGGVFLAGSGQSITVQATGVIEALGGTGGAAGVFGRRGASGGGGGGLVHLVAPVVTQSGSINVSGGAGGAAAPAGTVSAAVAAGGHGGAGSCGDGGASGSVAADGSSTAGSPGAAGCSLITQMNPVGFW